MKKYILFIAFLFLVSNHLYSKIMSEDKKNDKMLPTPVLLTFDGKYQFMANLYYSGELQKRKDRSVVVLNFMSLDCGPCRKELPIFKQVIDHFSDETKDLDNENDIKIRFFVVSLDPLSKKEELRELFKKESIDLDRVLLDPYRKAAEKYDVTAIPRTLLISERGELKGEIKGAVENYEKILNEMIVKALKSEKNE